MSNADGTTTVYVQADTPTDSLCARTYWPDAAILDGRWSPPKVEPTQ